MDEGVFIKMIWIIIFSHNDVIRLSQRLMDQDGGSKS